jgi:hypothetical protein
VVFGVPLLFITAGWEEAMPRKVQADPLSPTGHASTYLLAFLSLNEYQPTFKTERIGEYHA